MIRSRLILAFFALALVTSTLGIAPFAHAQTNNFGGSPITAPTTLPNAANGATLTSTIPNINPDGTVTAGTQTVTATLPSSEPVTGSPAANSAAANTPTTNLTGTPPAQSDWLDWIMSELMILFAWLLGIAAITLDNVMYYTVVHMGSYVNGLSAVGVAWRILRDIGNIVLIFGFVALGIEVILDLNFYGGGTKMLPTLLIAALFLNFSLFAAEAVIDVGNLFATEFYTQINNGQAAAPSADYSSAAAANNGISYAIMNQLGLQTIYGGALGVNGQNDNKIFTSGNAFELGFMSILLFLIAAFVFFSLSFILIARFIALIFLIVVAPIGFAGLAVPKLESSAKLWWSQLFEQTITAPILLLMLYVALAVITDAKFLTGFGVSGSDAAQSGWTGWLGGTTGLTNLAGLMLSFLVAMGLLLGVTFLAKRLGAFGGAWATRWGGRLSFGVASLGLRSTLGLTGNALTSKRMMAAAKNNWALRPLVFAGRGLRGATYDPRNLSGFGAALGAAGIDAGKGATFTAKDAHDAQYGWKPVKTYFQESEKEYDAAKREVDFKKAQSALEVARQQHGNGEITDAEYDRIKDENERTITTTLSKMPNKDLEQLSGIKKGVEDLVKNLSPQQFEAMMKSDKLTDSEKDKVKKARYAELGRAIEGARTGNPAALEKTLSSISKSDLESMPVEMLMANEVLDKLSDKQRDSLVDSKERTSSEKARIKAASKGGKLESMFDNPTLGPAAAAMNLVRLSPQQVAKLPKRILTNAAVASKLTPAQLTALQKEDKLEPGEIAAIAASVGRSGSPAAQAHIINTLNAWYWS